MERGLEDFVCPHKIDIKRLETLAIFDNKEAVNAMNLEKELWGGYNGTIN